MQERPVCPRGLYHGFVSWPHQHWRSIFRPQWSDTHHLIVAHDVINQGHDRAQLAAMSKKAKGVLGTDKLEVLADAGYFSGEEILECDKADITTTLPKPLTSGIRPIRRTGPKIPPICPRQRQKSPKSENPILVRRQPRQMRHSGKSAAFLHSLRRNRT